MKTGFYLGIACYLLTLPVLAQSNLRFERLTTKHGLSHNNVRSILQDRKDYLWFGSYGGISCYNGHSFSMENLVNQLAGNPG